jgi:putative membrane protein
LRRPLDYIFLFIKGLCIGATGVLQGVSGGSLALLLGVYEKLIYSLCSIDKEAFRLLKEKRLSDLWSKINGNFLLTISAGIITGLLTLRVLLGHLFNQYFILLSSFFFSLVIIAALLLLRKIKRWNFAVVGLIVAGIAISYYVTRIPPVSSPHSLLFSGIAGVLVGFTFIMPGVSGAFILMFIGKYQHILTSFGSPDFGVIVVFILGGIVGVILMARVIWRLLADFHNLTIALLAGLMMGSLNKIWPWREVYEYSTTLQGKRVPAFDMSILPWRYMDLTGKDPQVFYAILMMGLGVFIVVLIEKIAARLKTRS